MYHGSTAVTTAESTLHSMAGSSLGPVLHGASVLLFLAGVTSLIVSLGHLRSKQECDSATPRRRVTRTLDRLHPEDVETLYLQGIFSALINATVENNNNEALLILLPALEKFENVMVEESRKIRTALMDHDSRIENLEEFISRQGDEDVQNTQEIHPNRVDQDKARIKVTRSKAQNEVLKKAKKRKEEIILKETLKKTPVDVGTPVDVETPLDVEIARNETFVTVLQNDSVVVEDVKNRSFLKNDTLTNNDTVLISDTVLNTRPNEKSGDFWINETVNSNFTGDSIGVNETDSFRLGNTSRTSNNSGEINATMSVVDNSFNESVTSYPDNTTVGAITSTTKVYKPQLPVTTHTVAMTTTSTIPPTITATNDVASLEKTVLNLEAKVSRLENLKVNSGKAKWNSYKKKIKVLEKNLAEMKRRYRKMKSRLNSQNSKISGIEILQSVAYSGMPRDMMKEYEAKKATILRFDRNERRLTNYRDMVIRNRHEIRDLKGLTSKQEHYISELQAGSDRFEHKGRELTASMHAMEATIGNLFNSLNGYMGDMRWELRVMLDRVCGDNHLHC